MAEQPSFPGFERVSREQRIAEMDEEILDVTRAAKVLGVSSRTVYSMARQDKIPATRVGREWRFSRAVTQVPCGSSPPSPGGPCPFPYPGVAFWAISSRRRTYRP